MVTPTCPKCKQAIPGDDVNVSSDVAYCRACNLSHPLSALTHGDAIDPNIDVGLPPAGAWCTHDGTETVVGATHRSLGAAVLMLLFGLFWNGILSVFVAIALSGTVRHLGITLPDWAPSPNFEGGPLGVGMTIFLWVFLLPFIAIGLGLIAAFLSSIAGRTVVRIGNPDTLVFIGIGSIGYRRRFATAEVKQVRIDDRSWRDGDGDTRRTTNIVVETRNGKQIKFGSMLTPQRRAFVAAALRRFLAA